MPSRVWKAWPLSPPAWPVAAAGDRSAGRTRKAALNLALAVGMLVVACLGLEAALAMARINGRSRVVFDPEKGVAFAPGAYYVERKEGFSEGHFNSHGFRDYERTWEKPPNTYRILVLGDSYVEAFQVPLERAFPALLEVRLNAASRARRFEVLAMGQSGFGTADEYMRYLDYGVRYCPDMVILAFLTGNDVSDNSKVLHREHIGFYFRLDEHGELVLDRSALDAYAGQTTLTDRFFRAVKRHSYLASLVSERAYLLREQMREERYKQAHATAGAPEGGLDEFSDLNVYRPDPTPRWREAWEITEKLILKFEHEVESRGGSFVLVSLSNAEQVHPELQRELVQKYGLPFDFDLPDRRLRRLAEQHGIQYLDLMPALRDYHRRTGIYVHGFGSVVTGHWNETGHRQAADEIFSFLRSRGLVPLDDRPVEQARDDR
ncbi:MAG: hypothetical protein DMF80_22425 [Acidobacteria bacterium]|nr:MAG: hypothetical protein DMF80_22425 [Acidobacteriota bacterium]